MLTGDYCGTLSSFKHLQNILCFRSLYEPVCGLAQSQSAGLKSLYRDVIMSQFGCCLCQVRHAAANVLRECWLLHRTNLKKGNGGEHRRHQRCLLEAIRVWVSVSLHKRFRPLVWIKGESGWRPMARVFHVCILWIVKRASTCFGCRVTVFKGWLTYSMGFFLLWVFLVLFVLFCFVIVLFVRSSHALTHFCYSLLSGRCIVNCGTSWLRV